MYVTRPLSWYQDNPEATAEPPPEGPGSGFLVVEDAAAVERATCCSGSCFDRQVYGLPFPQSWMLEPEEGGGKFVFVPVVGEPLSSRRYYVVSAAGKHAGKVLACSREDDKTTCCFCSCVNNVPPRPFDRGDVYQQVQVAHLSTCSTVLFKAEAVAPDGIPPYCLRRNGWQLHKSKRYNLTEEARGTD